MTGRAAVVVLALTACQRNAAPPPGATAVSGDAAPGRARAQVGEATGVWADFTPTEGGVTVSMPGVPRANPSTRAFAGGVVADDLYLLATPDYAIAYTVSVSQFPAGALKDIPLDQLLQSTATHALSVDADARRRDTPSIVGDLPALDATATTREGLIVRVRVVAGTSVDRLYAIGVSVRPEKADAPEVARFLASMRVR